MKKINPTLAGLLKSFGILAFLLAFAYLLASCDYIENNYYECTVNQQVDTTTTVTPQVTTVTAIDPCPDKYIDYTSKIASYTYHLWMEYPEVNTVADYYNLVAQNGADFLTNIVTYSATGALKVPDNYLLDKFREMGYFVSTDLNQAAAGDYVRMGFVGQSKNVSAFKELDLTGRVEPDKIVTGIRVVSITSDRKNVPETIQDPWMENVTWHLVDSYEGSKNLNSKTRTYGDALYTYITYDYTGIEITITHPYYAENYDRLKDSNIMTAMLGGICTWSGGSKTAWKPSVDQLQTGATAKLPLDDYYNDDAKVIMRNTEFVRLYDRNMEPIQGDDQYRPAQLNRNAGGNKLLLSYSFIEENSPYWINQ